MVIALNEKIVRYQKRIGLQGYEGLPFGTRIYHIFFANKHVFVFCLLLLSK